MKLIDARNPKNISFTNAFENAAEKKLVSTRDIKEAFRDVALAYAAGSGVILGEIEIEYAADLYVGVNPWSKGLQNNCPGKES